jgi:hypothetical protein
MDTIETMRCMLRDPVWWREEAGWDAEENKKVRDHHRLQPLPPIAPQGMTQRNIFTKSIPDLLKLVFTEVAANGFGPTRFGLEGGWFDDDGTFILGGKTPSDWQLTEVQPGLTVWIEQTIDDDDEIKLQMYPSEWLHIANDGCQANWYVYCDGKDFPVIYEADSDVIYWEGERLAFETFEERIALFGGEVFAPSFDGWMTDWVRCFQNKLDRWYDGPKVRNELFPEPMYLKHGENGYRLVTAGEW